MPCDGSAEPSTSPSKKPPGCWGRANRPFARSRAVRLPLSAKFAHRLSTQTGIRAKWFLGNRLEESAAGPD